MRRVILRFAEFCSVVATRVQADRLRGGFSRCRGALQACTSISQLLVGEAERRTADSFTGNVSRRSMRTWFLLNALQSLVQNMPDRPHLTSQRIADAMLPVCSDLLRILSTSRDRWGLPPLLGDTLRWRWNWVYVEEAA